MSSDNESQRLDPTLFLGVTSPDGTPTAEPLFAAVHVTQELVDRLQLLADLCITHGLQSVTTTSLPEPVHWDIPADSELSKVSLETLWRCDRDIHSATLRGRRPLPEGGDGSWEDIAHTMYFDVDDARRLREQGYLVEFVEVPGQDEVLGEPFALMVHRRMALMGLWPPVGVQYEVGGAQDEDEAG